MILPTTAAADNAPLCTWRQGSLGLNIDQYTLRSVHFVRESGNVLYTFPQRQIQGVLPSEGPPVCIANLVGVRVWVRVRVSVRSRVGVGSTPLPSSHNSRKYLAFFSFPRFFSLSPAVGTWEPSRSLPSPGSSAPVGPSPGAPPVWCRRHWWLWSWPCSRCRSQDTLLDEAPVISCGVWCSRVWLKLYIVTVSTVRMLSFGLSSDRVQRERQPGKMT